MLFEQKGDAKEQNVTNAQCNEPNNKLTHFFISHLVIIIVLGEMEVQ